MSESNDVIGEWHELEDIPEEIMLNLDPEYRKVLNELLNKLRSEKNKAKADELIESFSTNYLTLSQLWKYRRGLGKGYDELLVKECSNFFMLKRSFRARELFEKPSNKTLEFKWKKIYRTGREGSVLFKLEAAKDLLTFPHAHLQEIYEHYLNYSDQVLPQNIYLKYKKALKYYDRIINAKNLREKLDFIVEVGDDRMIIQNIELIITQQPCRKLLWKCFLGVLIHLKQPRAYLDAFRKYTKFFISDEEMLQKYEDDCRRLHQTFEYENSPTLESFYYEQQPEGIKEKKKSKKIYRNFYKAFDNYDRQRFSLPFPLITYMLNSAKPHILRALFESCKQMFLWKPTPICYNLSLSHGFVMNGQVLRCYQHREIPKQIQNLLIVNVIYIHSPKTSSVISPLIPRISKCFARVLNFKDQIISWSEFRFLTSSENLEVFKMRYGRITNALGEVANFSEVIGRMPYAQKIFISAALKTTKTTTAELAALSRYSKLKYFSIGDVSQDFEYYDFEKFLRDNAVQEKPSFTIQFKAGLSPLIAKEFANLMKERLSPNFCRPFFFAVSSQKWNPER